MLPTGFEPVTSSLPRMRSTTRAMAALVQPVGIEPTSDGLQPPAMTTSAKVASP